MPEIPKITIGIEGGITTPSPPEDAVTAEAASEQAIRNAAAELGKTVGDAAVVLAKVHQQVDAVWTERQRELLREHREDRADAVDSWLSELASP